MFGLFGKKNDEAQDDEENRHSASSEEGCKEMGKKYGSLVEAHRTHRRSHSSS